MLALISQSAFGSYTVVIPMMLTTISLMAYGTKLNSCTYKKSSDKTHCTVDFTPKTAMAAQVMMYSLSNPLTLLVEVDQIKGGGG